MSRLLGAPPSLKGLGIVFGIIEQQFIGLKSSARPSRKVEKPVDEHIDVEVSESENSEEEVEEEESQTKETEEEETQTKRRRRRKRKGRFTEIKAKRRKEKERFERKDYVSLYALLYNEIMF